MADVQEIHIIAIVRVRNIFDTICLSQDFLSVSSVRNVAYINIRMFVGNF